MSYIDNPYNSDVGKALLKQNLKNIFIVGEEPNTFEDKSKDTMVGNFRKQTNKIITIMKRFVKGYKQISLGDSYDSGIYVCPSCNRRDFMYHWESVDLGIYTPKDWLGSVKPIKVNSGIPNFGKGNLIVMNRVRCNTVSTCNKCHLTWQGEISDCMNPSCNGGSEYMVTVGCGAESCAMHYIKEKTLEQQYPINELTAGRGAGINRQVIVFRHGRVTEVRGNDRAFELLGPTTSPLSGRPTDLNEVVKTTPSLRMTYGAEHRTRSVNYPLSLYRYGFSSVRKRFCQGKIDSYGNNSHQYRGRDGRVWLTKNHNGGEIAACPECGAMEPPTVLESKSVLPPRPLVIENPQPLSNSVDIISSHEGQPVWQIYVSDPADARERSNFLIPVAQAWNLQTIPKEVTTGEVRIGRSSCPNDVGFAAAVDNIKGAEGEKTESIVKYLALPRARVKRVSGFQDEYDLAKKEKKIPELFSSKPEGYVVCIKSESGTECTVSGIEPAEDGTIGWELKMKKSDLEVFTKGLGESGPNFTYAVCEGRSKAAFRWNGKWVDCSPPCKSYRAQDGSVLKKPRQYPRFNQYPDWYWEAFESEEWENTKHTLIQGSNFEPADPAGFQIGDYLWMDELSHLIMDPLRYGPIMEKAVNNLMTYHDTKVIAEEIDLDLGSKTQINECQTCKKAYNMGSIKKCRLSGGFITNDGQTKIPFLYPQEVYDLEIEYEEKYGTNQIDKPIAWGVKARGKDMVSNPTQIRID